MCLNHACANVRSLLQFCVTLIVFENHKCSPRSLVLEQWEPCIVEYAKWMIVHFSSDMPKRVCNCDGGRLITDLNSGQLGRVKLGSAATCYWQAFSISQRQRLK